MDTIDKVAALTNAIDFLTQAARATLVGREDRAGQAIMDAQAILSEAACVDD